HRVFPVLTGTDVLEPVHTNWIVTVVTKKAPIEARGVSLVDLNERRATTSGAFLAATPSTPKKGAGIIFAPSVVGIRLFGMTKPRSFRLAGGKNDLQQ
ncbi:MAG: hypothetical protein AB7U63_11255, partial [Porticoccaceae bacterium]